MNQVIESALQREPVVIFRTGPQFPGFQCFHPARHGRVLVDILVRSQSTKSALRQMAVRRDKARENEFSLGVIGGLRLRARGRVAFADGFDLSVVAHQDVANERLRLPGLHGQVRTVDDEQLIYGEDAVRAQQNSQERLHKKSPSDRERSVSDPPSLSRAIVSARAIHQGLGDLFAGRGYRLPYFPGFPEI